MKRIIALFLVPILMMAAALPLSFTASAADSDVTIDGEYVLDEIIIGFFPRSMFPGKEKQYDNEVAKVLKDGLSLVSEDVYVVRSEAFKKNPNATLNQYKNSQFIEYVEPNYIMTTAATPDDTYYRNLNAVLTALNAPTGWDIVTGGGPIIAIVDSGVAPHSDLPDVQNGYAAVSALVYSNDKRGHGTQVAGVAGAIGNNGIGITGINWNANILPVKVDDANGTLAVANTAKGVMWAADNGAKIINLSLGSRSDSVTMKNAINYAYNKGCVIAAAAGNEGVSGVSYPARYPNVLGVGSTTNGTSKAATSNYGAGLDVVAVGSYKSTTASGGYTNVTGTSFASPQVAALASLMWTINPDLTNDQIYSYIIQGAKPLGGGYNANTAYGLIDIGKTLALVKSTAAPQVAIDTTAPVLTLTGDGAMEVEQGKAFTDPGYKAVDDVDGDITSKVVVTGSVNVNAAGVYKIEYTVADAAGNKSAATRVVEVVAVVTPIPEPEPPLGEPSPEMNPVADIQGGAKSFLIEAAVGSRNDYNGSVGYEFECLKDMTVLYLGRPLNGTMNSSHKINIWDAKASTILATAEVKPDSPLDALGFKVAELDSAITLKAGGKYRIVSAETTGGDKWYDVSQTDSLIPNADCRITTAVYTNEGAHASYPGNTYSPGGNKGYTGVTFYYALASDAVQEPVKPADPVYHTPPVITLNGSVDVTLFVDEEYVETGYKAVDCFGVDLSGAVKVTNNINIWTPGVYKIDYTVQDAGGNTARETRTVIVAEREVAPPPADAPTLTIIGSDPIILHIDSGTPYTEQGADAYDEVDGDLSSKVQISGNVNRDRAGTYTLTYRVTNSAGLDATATRTVRILAPTEGVTPRTTSSFSGQGKPGKSTTHKTIKADHAGYMDFSVTSLDKGMTIEVVVREQGGDEVYSDTFTGVGGTQFWVEAGKYEAVVTIVSANGNSKYGIRLVTPEVAYVGFEEEEIPLSSPELIKDLISDGTTPLEVCLLFDLPTEMLNAYYGDFIAAGWSEEDLRWFGLGRTIDDEKLPLGGLPGTDVTSYVVVAGDSLSSIAYRLYGDSSRWLEIYDMNREVIEGNPNLIYVGQVFKVKVK